MRLGLCGWTVSQSSYVRRFPVLEVQHTFYEPPADTVLARWRAQVPAGFEFTIKAWQLITHESNSPTYRRLKVPLPDSARGQVGAFRTTPPVLAGWQRTLECARILRATAVLLQCPKSFRPTADNVERLRSFVSQVERPAGRLLWEPRGEWPTPLLTELCAELDLVHVVDPMQGETVTPNNSAGRRYDEANLNGNRCMSGRTRRRPRQAGRPTGAPGSATDRPRDDSSRTHSRGSGSLAMS